MVSLIIIVIILVIACDMAQSKVIQAKKEKREQEKKLVSNIPSNKNYNTKLNSFFSSVIEGLDDLNDYLEEKNKQLEAFNARLEEEFAIQRIVKSDPLLNAVDVAIRCILLFKEKYNDFLRENMLSDSPHERKKFTKLYNVELPPFNKILSREDFIKISQIDLPNKSIDLVEQNKQLAIDDQSEKAKLIRAYMSKIMELYDDFLKALSLTDTLDTRKMFTGITNIALPPKEDK